MSGRSKQGGESGAERRAGSGHRVHFEALVAVGAASGGAGFEAESVDVSADGMRLRTAYLPSVGDRLVCRFDGLDAEVLIEGEVVWATEQQKGGEFAVRFVELDDETRELLKELCFAESQGISDDKPVDRSLAGTRVRLHIEGLGSPMKARIRSGDERELSVGSSLEFLKLGRPVELEDVDRQKKREGFVDAVKVEVDPESSIPQLVVSLRFEGKDLVARAEVAPPPAPAAKSKKGDSLPPPANESPKTRPGIGPEIAGAAATASASTTEAAPERAGAESEMPGTVRARDNDAAVEDDEELEFGKSKLRVAGDKAKALGEKAAAKIGPAINGLGTSARGVWDKVQSGIAKRREKRADEARENAPRRVTAPPPSGALKSSGRKVVREENNEMEPDSIQIPKNSKKRAVLGAIVGIGLVAGAFGAVKAMSGGSADSKKPIAAHTEANKTELPAIPGPAVGNVPLYGATPLSTTEEVPTPAPSASAATAAADKADDASSGDEEKPASEPVKEWGHGDVAKAKILRIKMDGPVAGITGEEVDGGFVLHVPGRKSLSSSSGLARKDKRLSAVDVVNHDDESEITVKFRGDTPGYLAKVKDNKIEIHIGGDAGKVTAAKPSKKKPAGAKPSKKSHKH